MSERGELGTVREAVRRSEGRWIGERIADSKALLHAVCIDGGAVFVAGYDRELRRIVRESGAWRAEVVGALPGAGKSAVVARGGVVVACTDGSLVLFRRSESGWSGEVIDHRATGRARSSSPSPTPSGR